MSMIELYIDVCLHWELMYYTGICFCKEYVIILQSSKSDVMYNFMTADQFIIISYIDWLHWEDWEPLP
jgi:hypothetical protein